MIALLFVEVLKKFRPRAKMAFPFDPREKLFPEAKQTGKLSFGKAILSNYVHWDILY